MQPYAKMIELCLPRRALLHPEGLLSLTARLRWPDPPRTGARIHVAFVGRAA